MREKLFIVEMHNLICEYESGKLANIFGNRTKGNQESGHFETLLKGIRTEGKHDQRNQDKKGNMNHDDSKNEQKELIQRE